MSKKEYEDINELLNDLIIDYTESKEYWLMVLPLVINSINKVQQSHNDRQENCTSNEFIDEVTEDIIFSLKLSREIKKIKEPITKITQA